MEKDLVNIISEKSYLELTQQELNEVGEYVKNEDEYNQMKEVFLMMESVDVPVLEPKVETKQRLDALFDETYPKASPVWYMSALSVVFPKDKSFIQQPMLKVAALVVLIFLIYPFLQSDNLGTVEPEQLAQTEIQTEQELEQNDLPQKVQEFVEENNEQSIAANERLAEEDDYSPVIEPLQEDRAMEAPIPVADFELSRDLMSVPATVGTTETFSSVAETGFDHPDGIFDETVSVPSKSVSADRNPAVLDLLTATF